MLDLHAETLAEFRGQELSGRIRLGVPDDYAAKYLTPVLKRFAPSHGAVEIELSCEQSTALIPRVESGELDLALVSRNCRTDPMQRTVASEDSRRQPSPGAA